MCKYTLESSSLKFYSPRDQCWLEPLPYFAFYPVLVPRFFFLPLAGRVPSDKRFSDIYIYVQEKNRAEFTLYTVSVFREEAFDERFEILANPPNGSILETGDFLAPRQEGTSDA